MDRPKSLALRATELASMFADEHWAREFPPVLSVEQAARLAHLTPDTIYDWSSRGLLRDFAHKKGKRLRILRDRFVEFLFSEQASG
jgi:Helix-turn-helix domain